MNYCRFCSILKFIICIIFLFLFLFLLITYYELKFSKDILLVLKPASNSGETSPEREHVQVGYMMTCAVPEQLESGMYDLYQLADLAESWGMKMVEPTIHGSTFQFPLSEKYHWKLRNIFDLIDLNLNFRKDFKIDYDLVVSSHEILADKKLGSDAVFIQWVDVEDLSSEKCFELASSTVLKCFKETPMYKGSTWELWKWKLLRNTICLRRRDQINFRALIYDNPILRQVAQENKKIGSKFTIFFSQWNGIRPKPDTFFFFDPNFHQRDCVYVHAIMHSKEVRNVAKEFKEDLKLKQTFIGIHIRIEKLLSHKYSVSDVNKCIDELEFNIKMLMRSHLNSSFIAFTDYKPLGSHACDAHCIDTSKELAIDERLRSLGVLVNPMLKNSKKSSLRRVSGFVANVEQELLSQADFLILTGFGGFQVGITKRYMRYHSVVQQIAEARFIRICQKH